MRSDNESDSARMVAEVKRHFNAPATKRNQDSFNR